MRRMWGWMSIRRMRRPTPHVRNRVCALRSLPHFTDSCRILTRIPSARAHRSQCSYTRLRKTSQLMPRPISMSCFYTPFINPNTCTNIKVPPPHPFLRLILHAFLQPRHTWKRKPNWQLAQLCCILLMCSNGKDHREQWGREWGKLEWRVKMRNVDNWYR